MATLFPLDSLGASLMDFEGQQEIYLGIAIARHARGRARRLENIRRKKNICHEIALGAPQHQLARVWLNESGKKLTTIACSVALLNCRTTFCSHSFPF